MHLDKVFPSPPLFPSGDARYALLVAVGKIASLLEPGFRPLIVPRVADHLDPRGQKYFHETRSAALGKPLSEVRPTDKESLDKLWKLVETESAALIKMLKGTEGKKGPFFEGEEPGFADFRPGGLFYLVSSAVTRFGHLQEPKQKHSERDLVSHGGQHTSREEVGSHLWMWGNMVDLERVVWLAESRTRRHLARDTTQ
ncbi:uncharacterized protein ASPGLDRAFT_24399 [Aspergillus glaucus CBS 516.65]|uniref:Glutathione S-transferase UstS-like C-terminal domain-containing protein n=1 Tax=Aspergillus glaucus CBS 516.65 TaxID=1160497 RepID=A0A1L9VQS9_ASPGL|nr:hypothetical protein ASPGLDRAFT_24399 [Aspergillus glaucus CBS 516.65]OJJ86273.1 hypothetical protein ASPGLDRAFT_24399 [Aspergillus glaucus CBS 516.65]